MIGRHYRDRQFHQQRRVGCQDRPRQWGLTGEKNWATKYGAAGFIPRMLAQSPFETSNWREANASVVVLFARQFAGGPAIVQQQCLQRLRQRLSSCTSRCWVLGQLHGSELRIEAKQPIVGHFQKAVFVDNLLLCI